MTKLFLRTFIFASLAFLFLYLMHIFGLLRWNDISQAFARHPKTILGVCVLQLVTAVVMMLRYWKLLQLFGISADLKRSSTATFISTALGQWFPGSMAVVEMLRVGLMFGVDSQTGAQTAGMASGIKARLAIVSIVDRLVGFLGILSMGLIASGVLQLFFSADSSVFLLFSFALLGVAGLVALPVVARLRWTRTFFKSRLSAGVGSHPTAAPKKLQTLLRHLESLRHDVEAGTRHPARLVGPVLLSMVSLLLTSASLFLSARALGERLDFFQIVCVFPIVSLASVLPLGFAGIGGYQLVMASLFGLFAVSPAVVASAGLLQSALLLLVNSLLGLAFLKSSAHLVRDAMRRA